MPRIEALEFDERVLDAVAARQGVSFDEIEQTCLDRAPVLLRGRDGGYRLLGRTPAGRYLTVELEDRGAGVWAPLVARGMTGREWRRYQAEGERPWTSTTSRPATRPAAPRTRPRPSISRSPGR